MSWQTMILGDVVTLKRGHDLPERDRREGPVPIVSSSGVTGFHNVAKAEPPGVVTGRYGTLGEVYFIDEPYWPLNTSLYAIDFHENDPKFVSYFLRQALKGASSSSKAAVPGVNRNDLHALKVKVPDRDVQERIAGILSAYDDLIENNRRRIKLLEEAARLIYREWFVRLRFPGHETASSSTELPEGWIHTALSTIATVIRGRSYKGSELSDTDGRHFVNLKCFVRYGGFRESGLKRFTGPFKEKQCVEAGDIVMAVTDMTQERMIVAQAARIPKTVEPGAVISMDVVKLEPSTDIDKDWLYFFLRFSGFSELVSKYGTGATVVHLSPSLIEDHVCVVPRKEVQTEFGDLVRPLMNQIDVLLAQNNALEKARDLLLPRLMSGEIEV